jgi:histone H3/H4
MSRARRVLPEKKMSKEAVDELREVLRALGKAAIE